MHPGRNFDEATSRQFTRKPGNFRECALTELHTEQYAAVPVHRFLGGWPALEDLCAERLTQDEIEFAALDDHTGAVYLVNTEGAFYPRYMGRLARGDAANLLDAHDEIFE